MITPLKADHFIKWNLSRFPSIRVSLNDAHGCILAEDIFSDRDAPDFDKALMDGIAISMKGWKAGNKSFFIRGLQAAGQAPKSITRVDHCYEIATGAVIPKGCDCVIPMEKVTVQGSRVSFKDDIRVHRGQYIQQRGSYQRKGSRVLRKGVRLTSAQLAICASVGHARVRIIRPPRIAVITTGDELVPVQTQNIKPFQVRQSNAVAMQVAFENHLSAHVRVFHLKDNKKEMLKRIRAILAKFDVFVLSGGVSMGKLDFVPGVFTELGAKVIFHKVSQKPGRPFWFGVIRERKPIFALPGNPLSTQICLYRYVIFHLQHALGYKSADHCAVLSRDYENRSAGTYFLPVKTFCNESGRVMANPADFSGSGNVASLGDTDGFVELPNGRTRYSQGAVVKLFMW